MTHIPFSARGAFGAVAIVTALLAAPGARAQVSGVMGTAMQTGTPSGGISDGSDPDARFRKPALPPGLPGARTVRDRAAPAEKPATDMEPTDALFDAVNRGDIAAAREALSRGADINAHNILGLTPTDLSVDLGHTNITFLLLSMRGAAPATGAGRAPPRAAAAASGTGGVRVASAPLTAVHSDAPGAAPLARPAPVVARAAPAPRPAVLRPAIPRPAPRPAAARIVADDSGTPRPSVGFLGFGR